MRELALNVLDIAENSLRAGAKLVQITLSADFAADTMSIAIEDDGCGMSEEMLASVCDPFTTTRTTRKVGRGVPLFKYSAESAGGTFSIRSKIGEARASPRRTRSATSTACRSAISGSGSAACDDESRYGFPYTGHGRPARGSARHARGQRNPGGRHSSRRARSARLPEGVHSGKFSQYLRR